VEHGDEPVLIGRPVANTQCYILNEQRQPVPIGCVGELYIAGDGLARGYLNRPELTAEKFVPDPFGERTGARMYRTGDLARYLPDGNIECLGRTDHQVKMRGFRIELGEIETALKRHPGIRQAVVVAREDTPAEKRLVAYFVPSGAPAPERAELSSFLKRQLPEYMVPSDYVALESLPISPNGKIDRKSLPAPTRGEEAGSPSGAYVAPRTETERTLVEIFSEVLGTRQVGIDDDFFDLGGHSLTAMRAISLIKSKLNAELPVRVLFRAKTVSQIAAYIAERDAGRAEQSSDEWSTCIPIQPGGSKVPLFCVARPNVNALGYLFLSRQLGPDQPVYGLQRQMLEDPQVDFTPEQIRATAEEYIRVMRSIQPRGPYFLVGNCQGAYIAFEMTRQLESQGERVGMLGMLDVWPEENTRYKTLFFANLYARKLLRLLRRKVATAATSQTPPPDIKLAEGGASAPAAAGRSGNPQWRIYWPAPGFEPVVVSSRIVVFHVASQAFYRKRDKAMGWRNRTSGGVEVEEIPGGHITFLREPFVKVLAEKLNRQMLVSLKGS
jgi:aspartate racemase